MTALAGCGAQTPAPAPAHTDHNLAHNTPQTQGHSTDIETTNPKSTQKVELEVQQDDMVLKTIKGDANGLILVCERPHEGELEV
jgi:hypothetical protein